MTGVREADPETLAGRKARFWEQTDYDRAFRGTFGAYMTAVEAAALERALGDLRFAALLDLGCGHGRFLRWLAPRAERLAGLDRSWRLLGIAIELLKDDPLAVPTALIWGSATELPFATGSLDGVTCVRVIQHVPDQRKALEESARVLRAGGSLVLVQYNWLSPHGLVRALKLPVKALLRRAMRAAGREPAFDEPTGWTWWPALRRELESAGFAIEHGTGAWLFPLQYFRSRRSNDAWPWALALANALERLADTAPFKFLGGYLVVRAIRNS
ncbi:MAG: class I SAM-dependent methyltransferase [Acidobacteria bacterium]|nr:class I SAM-dependent methyltransferase [Acidobacteriota bacterium]